MPKCQAGIVARWKGLVHVSGGGDSTTCQTMSCRPQLGQVYNRMLCTFTLGKMYTGSPIPVHWQREGNTGLRRLNAAQAPVMLHFNLESNNLTFLRNVPMNCIFNKEKSLALVLSLQVTWHRTATHCPLWDVTKPFHFPLALKELSPL